CVQQPYALRPGPDRATRRLLRTTQARRNDPAARGTRRMVDPMALPIRKSGQFRRLRGVTALVMTALALTVPAAFTPAAAQAQTAAIPNAVITWNTHAQTALD